MHHITSIVVSIALSLVFSAVLRYFGGIVEALAEIYRATPSPWPMIATVAVASGVAWFGVALWRVALTPGEHFVAVVLVMIGGLFGAVATALWRATREVDVPDHEPRG
jgi:hypothetical protein